MQLEATVCEKSVLTIEVRQHPYDPDRLLIDVYDSEGGAWPYEVPKRTEVFKRILDMLDEITGSPFG